MNSIVEAVAKWAEQRPDKVAVIAEGQQITYAELWHNVRGFADYLHSTGLVKGDRVVVKAQHAIWYAVACLGVHLSGCTFIPVEKLIGVEGLKSIAERLAAAMIISNVDLADVSCKRLDSSSVMKLAAESFKEDAAREFPQSQDMCDILFTTGTTGKPKGVMLSHRAVVAVAENVQHGIGILDNNIYLIPSPMDHAAGIRNLYLCMLTGTKAVLLDGYANVKKLFEYIRDYHVTGVYLPPSAVRMILLLTGRELAKYAEQIQYVYTSSAPFPEADKERLINLLPNTRLYYAYGCSEAGRSCIIDYSRIRGKDSCAGKPNINSRVLVVDDDRKEIRSSVNNQGLIAITGDTVMEGYFNDPELTAKTLVDGVVYTNDIGYLDEEGYLYVMGRRDDVINVGGLKIAPTEVEGVALRFPGVAECVCYPVQDRLSGVSPKLNIVEEAGAEVDTAALREYMLRHLEAYKVPKQIEKVDGVPKTPNGKIDRKVYRV